MPIADSSKIKEAIVRDIAPSELWGDPVFDESLGMWVVVVLVGPSGPLVRAGFKIKLSKEEA